MSVPKVVLHTDLFVEHLWGRKSPSLLRLALQKFFCYTTVFQAMQLFSLGRTEGERKAVQLSMAAVKVLGLNAKSAPRYGELLRKHGRGDVWSALIGGLCLESRLPILTSREQEFRRIPGLTVIPARMVESSASGEEILAVLGKAKRRRVVGKKRMG